MILLIIMMIMMLMMRRRRRRRVMMSNNHCRDLDYIVSAGNDGDINFWDARDGEWVQSYEVDFNIVQSYEVDINIVQQIFTHGDPISEKQQKETKSN